jgi:protein-tyrosine phosphatase
MIDLHSHILPGLDDGAATVADALALARAAAAVGVTTVAATPHVRDDYPTSPDEMEQAVSALGRTLGDAGVAVEIVAGGELSLDRLERLAEAHIRRFTLGGTGRYVLVEFPYYGWPFTLEAQLRRLRGQGIVPVLAHPERNPEVQQSPQRLERLRRGGALAQVTIDSLTGVLGRRARRTARALLETGDVDLLATDSHAPGAYSLDEAGLAEAVGDRRLSRQLTVEVPAAILAGETI